MKFIVSTKPLKTGLSLGIINSNVSKFYQKSTIVQITATQDTLRINVEAASIKSEICLKGVGDAEYASILVDSLLLKQLISTITTAQVTMEFQDNYLIIHADRSTYTVPKQGDVTVMELQRPQSVTESDILTATDVVKSNWKFIKDHQMFAKSESYTNPVYTYAWFGESGDVIVGDFINGLFTHSGINELNQTCLLSDTIINLFTTLPDGAKLVSRNGIYSIAISTDGYEFISEFAPKYESDENGFYNASIILDMMNGAGVGGSKVVVSEISTALNQAGLLSSDKEFKVEFVVNDTQLVISADAVRCVIPIKDGPQTPYSISFRYSQLRSVISNCSETEIYISPVVNGGVVAGIKFDSKDLQIVLAGVR